MISGLESQCDVNFSAILLRVTFIEKVSQDDIVVPTETH